MKQYLLILAAFILTATSAAGALTIQYDGEMRNRFAVMINKDQDFTRSDDFHIEDFRVRLGFKVEDDIVPFFLYYKAEVGNVPWGDIFKGGGLGYNAFNLRTKNAYVGWKTDYFSGRAGFMSWQTPLGAEFDDDLPGLFLKGKLDIFSLEMLLSKPFSGSNSLKTNSTVDINEFSLSSTNDALLAGLAFKAGVDKSWESSVYALFWTDSRFSDVQSTLFYAGAWHEMELEFADGLGLEFEAGASYNFGQGTENSNSFPVSAFFLHGDVRFNNPVLDVFIRYNHSSGTAEGQTNTIGQFQTIGNAGGMKSGMSILFGGSSFNQQFYFDDEICSLYRKNLTTGSLQFKDRGFIALEAGLGRDFGDFESDLSAGMAFTANSISNQNVLGIEVDWHNRYKFSKTTSLILSAACLLPGNALRDAYQLNETSITLGWQPVFKIDGELLFEF